MASNSIRALHYVYKFGDRNATASFYKDILGMKVSYSLKVLLVTIVLL